LRTRETIEAQYTSQHETAKSETAQTPKQKYARGENPRSKANLKLWKPGQSGNPGGRKRDTSQEIARAIFENNPELIYKAYGKLLSKGSAFGFQVLAERAYGKLKETRDTGSEFNEIPDTELQNAIDNILQRLGIAREADAAADAGIAQARATEATVAQKDS
jgi:hypothetical protein